MAYSSDRTISIEQLFGAIKRHKFTGLLTFLAVLGVVLAAWIFLPREYGSEGRLFVQLGRANMGMSTSPDNSGAVSIQDTRETEIRSVAELVKSTWVLGMVVDRVGADKILSNTIRLPFTLGGGGAIGEEMSAEEFKEARNREKAIEALSNNLTVFSEKKTSVISVYCTGPSPKTAQQIVSEIMDAVRNSHVEVHSAKRSRNFFDREFEEQQEILREAELAMNKFRDKHQFLSIDQARETLNGQIDKLENQLIDVSIDLSQSNAMVEELQNQFSNVDKQIEMPTQGMESLSTEGAQAKLNERIAEKARLLAKYNENNPKVTEIEKEIASLRAEVANLPRERVELNLAQNPVFEEIKVSLVTETSRAKSLQRRLEEVKSKHAETMVRLIELNRLATESAQYQRDVAVARQYFETYKKKRGEAKLIDDLDREKISDVVIQQPASLLLKKHSPKGSVMLPLGFVFATLCGFMAAIFADRKNLTGLSTPEEIEDALDIPVLVTIPRVHSSRVLTN